MRAKNRLQEDERGFASLVVALIMILVLSLITIGFAQLARREQQNALNKQLSSQAYYASETGINDAYDKAITPGTGLLAKEEAAPGTVNPNECLNNNVALWGPLNQSQIDTTIGASYSCVMVNLRPPSLKYTGVSPAAYRTVVFSATDLNGNSDNPTQLTIHWGSHDNAHTTPQNSDGFKPAASWGNSPGVIAFSLTPFNEPFSRDALINNTFTAFLFPRDGANAGTVGFDPSANGNAPVIKANCTGSGENLCQATITGVPAASNYLVHFINYYDTTDVTINGKDGSNRPIGFRGGQIVIDSTGRARDTLKRLQVHMPLKVIPETPDEPVEGQSICKRIATYPGALPSFERPPGYTPSSPANDACNLTL